MTLGIRIQNLFAKYLEELRVSRHLTTETGSIREVNGLDEITQEQNNGAMATFLKNYV